VAHLGERVAALVDGQLCAEAVERAHAHLAGCRACRDAVEAERLMKARLASLRGPEPSSDLRQRLLALGGPNGPMPPRVGHVPGSPRPQPIAAPRVSQAPAAAPSPVPVAVPVSAVPVSAVPGGVLVGSGTGPAAALGAAVDRPAGRRSERPPTRAGSSGPGRTRARRRTRLAVAAVFGALSVVGVGISGLTAGSAGASPSAPTVVPPVDTFVVDHARTTGQLPFVDVSAGWSLTSAGQDGGAGR
jgi:hypothetical protein